MKKSAIIAIVLLFLSFQVFPLDFSNDGGFFSGESVFSIEGKYMLGSLMHNGWGLGASYEKQFARFFSAKGTFSHTTFNLKDDGIWITTVGVNLGAFCYIAEKLEGLYFGGGMGTDFLMYDGDKESEKNSVITAYPLVGWKQNFMDYVRLDVFGAYRFLLNNEDVPDYASHAYEKGFEYGIKCSLNIVKIFKSVFRK